MKLTKKQKEEISKQMAEVLKKTPHMYFTQFQGLKFVELAQLRKKLKPATAKYQVIKNSVVAAALRQAGVEVKDEKLLAGPVGLVTSNGTDPVSAAKVLATFAKEFPLLKIKGGYVDGAWIDAAGCNALSQLGTKPEILSQLAGTLQNVISSIAGVTQAPIRDLALVISALKDKKSSEAPAAAPAA